MRLYQFQTRCLLLTRLGQGQKGCRDNSYATLVAVVRPSGDVIRVNACSARLNNFL
jgi:hypothetical protein